MTSPVQFVKETRAELKHVAWPSRKQTVQVTALVIGVSLFVALYLALFDQIFSIGLKALIQ